MASLYLDEATRATMRIALINLAVFLCSLMAGIVYTLACQIHPKLTQAKIYQGRLSTFRLKENLKLIVTNILILSLISVLGLTFFSDDFSSSTPTFLLFFSQFLIIVIFDDMEFYFWHRFLHHNKFMMKHIHSIHHRARVPYPIEFIYAHPIEWLGGMLGLVFAVILIIVSYGTLNAYVLWSYTAYRTLRELDIHSNITPYFFKYLPFLCNSKHHSLHHNRVRGNFSSTFTYLDRLFRTHLN